MPVIPSDFELLSIVGEAINPFVHLCKLRMELLFLFVVLHDPPCGRCGLLSLEFVELLSG